jgi:hypothetical protein
MSHTHDDKYVRRDCIEQAQLKGFLYSHFPDFRSFLIVSEQHMKDHRCTIEHMKARCSQLKVKALDGDKGCRGSEMR